MQRKSIIIIVSLLIAIVTWGREPNAYAPARIPPKRGIVTPRALSPGDKIAIVTPASYVDSSKINLAVEHLRNRGYEPVVMPHAYGHSGSYGATDQQRAADLMAAFADPEIAAILCTRGGYGSTRILPLLDLEVIKDNPKWLIGFSDISALHALMYRLGIVSVHGPMMTSIYSRIADYNKRLNPEPKTKKSKKSKKRGKKTKTRAPQPKMTVPKEFTDTCTDMLFAILEQGLPYTHNIKPHSYNKPGTATGRLVGGNLIVVNELAQTPYDVLNPGVGEDLILFVEDVGEQIYAIERLLLRLHLSGQLAHFKGIIFGDFTEYSRDEDFSSMYSMIYKRLREWGYYDKEDFVIIYGMPAGHAKVNYPLAMGAVTTIEADRSNVTISSR